MPGPSVPFEMPDDTVTRAVLALRPPLRRAVVLHYYQGLTVQETADALRLSLRAVHYRLDKAKKALKRGLEEWYRDE